MPPIKHSRQIDSTRHEKYKHEYRWHWTTFEKHKVKKKLSTDPSKTLQFILNESSSKLEKQNALEKIPKTTKAKMIEKTKKENPAHRV